MSLFSFQSTVEFFKVVILAKLSFLNALENMAGHMFADNCQAHLEDDSHQINNAIDKLYSDLRLPS